MSCRLVYSGAVTIASRRSDCIHAQEWMALMIYTISIERTDVCFEGHPNALFTLVGPLSPRHGTSSGCETGVFWISRLRKPIRGDPPVWVLVECCVRIYRYEARTEVGVATFRRIALSVQCHTRVYPKVSGLVAWSEKCILYSSLPLGAVVSLFCESV
jgi:hypothetical protein